MQYLAGMSFCWSRKSSQPVLECLLEQVSQRARHTFTRCLQYLSARQTVSHEILAVINLIFNFYISHFWKNIIAYFERSRPHRSRGTISAILVGDSIQWLVVVTRLMPTTSIIWHSNRRPLRRILDKLSKKKIIVVTKFNSNGIWGFEARPRPFISWQ